MFTWLPWVDYRPMTGICFQNGSFRRKEFSRCDGDGRLWLEDLSWGDLSIFNARVDTMEELRVSNPNPFVYVTASGLFATRDFCPKICFRHLKVRDIHCWITFDEARSFLFRDMARHPNLHFLLPVEKYEVASVDVLIDTLAPDSILSDNLWLCYRCSGTVEVPTEENLRAFIDIGFGRKVLMVSVGAEKIDLSSVLFCDRCRDDDACGRGAYETPLENAAGGPWFRECRCSKIEWVIVTDALAAIDKADAVWVDEQRSAQKKAITDLIEQVGSAGVPLAFHRVAGRADRGTRPRPKHIQMKKQNQETVDVD